MSRDPTQPTEADFLDPPQVIEGDVSKYLQPGEQLVRLPDDVRLEEWLQFNGVKSYWFSNVELAKEAGFQVDDLHSDVAALLRITVRSDDEEIINHYLLTKHGILPSQRIDLRRLKELLALDLTNSSDQTKARLIVTIDPTGDRSKAVFNGEPFPLTHDQAVYLDALVKANGVWVSGPSIEKQNAAFPGGKVSRIKNKLPPALLDLIESEKGKGSRIPKEKLRLS